MHFHHHREKHSIRAFWNFAKRSCLKVEFNWWTSHCLFAVDVDDEGWGLVVALPPFFLSFGIEGFGLWKPQVKSIATWDNNREMWLTDRRGFRVSFHDWAFRFSLWERSMEWRRSDPWWVRGVTFDLRCLLGKQTYRCETLIRDVPVSIQMPEGVYQGILRVERQEWRRPTWRTVRFSTWIDVPKGIPFAGKGENSWDCGDDGLFGCGVSGISQDRAIEHFRDSVMQSRKRNGMPSQQAVAEALG